MSLDHDLHGRFASDDPALALELESAGLALSAAIGRLLRHTPLAVLMRSRAVLVAALLAMPELHVALRASWERDDRAATATVFGWVERAKLHRDRSSGRVLAVDNWMRDLELAAA